MTNIPAGNYVLDTAHTEIGFSVRHAGIAKVRGSFREFEGALNVAENIEDSTANVTVQLSSVDTGNNDRDNHLRSADFFSVEERPTMEFTSTGVKFDGEDVTLTGNLTLNGVTKPIEFEGEFLGAAKDPFGNERIGFEAKSAINRKDFGVTWNAVLETGGLLVGEKVQINLEVSAIKQ